MTGFLLIGGDVIRLLFQRGHFTSADTVRTAAVLGSFSLGLLAYGWDYLGVRACYALGRTSLPIVGAVVSMATNAILDAALVGPFGSPGLAFASAAAGAVDAGILLFFLRRYVSWGPLLPRLGLIVGGTAIMATAVWGVARALPGSSALVATLVPTFVGLAVYGLFVRMTPLWKLVRRPGQEADVPSASD